MAQWPGFRTDAIDVWRRLDPRQITTLRSGEIKHAESLPLSVRYSGFGMRKVETKARLRQIAEEIAESGTVPATERLAPSRLRQTLTSGSQRSTPNHHILATALRFIPKGRDTFVGCILRAARNQDTDAQAWMQVFDALLPREQQFVDFDDICEACGVTPDRMMAIAVSTMMKVGSDTAEFVAAAFHPKIVHQTAKSAMRIGGDYAAVAQKDREFMLQHGKFVQGPRGVSVNVNATAAAQAAAAAAQQEPSVPTFADTVFGAQRTQIGVQRTLIETQPVEDAQ